ncbi:MAG TPA: hypothetical protein VJ343_01925 [archaeon]|nr:hypothetical protein [archaeon]
MEIPKEYEEFLKDVIYKRKSVYERFCKLSEKFHISPSSSLEKKYSEAINFAHLEITPKGAFSFSMLAGIFFSVFFLLLSFALNVLSEVVVVLVAVFDLLVFYYTYTYPFHLSTMFRIKASSEMVLGVIYMTIAMRIIPNIENAIKFAATNLSGPLSYDLRKMIWDLYTRKYDSISDALNDFAGKWKRENEEFVDSINLIRSSMSESEVRRERALDEAVSVILDGTKERMRRYAHDLRTPVSILNAMGVLLPIIGLIFFPLISMFMPDLVKPAFLAIGYDIILPVTLFWMMKSTLERRPYSFYQPDISKHPKFRDEKFFNKVFFLSIAVALPLIIYGSYQLSLAKGVFSFALMANSLIVVVGIASGITIYCILSVWKKIKLRNEIAAIEGEFAEALFQLGNQLGRGMPIEKALRDITPKIKELKISKFFEKMLYNIESFGMTFEQSVFNEESGAIVFYPSRTIEAIMKAIVEISKRGMISVSNSMISISKYMKDVRSVEEDLKDVLSESTSDMTIQSLLLAPLTSGVVVSLTAAMMELMVTFSEKVAETLKSLGSSGAAGMAGGEVLTSLININQMMPIHVFQLVVGIYLIEIVSMIATFISRINNGEENLLQRFSIGKTLILAIIIYAVLAVVLYLMFNSMLPSMLRVG